MSIQSEFIDFHDRIKLDYDVNTELAEKRDILVKKLRDNDELPGFEEFNQGSYGMLLGVEPLEGREYDIDVGLRFNADAEDYDPVDLKEKIADILKNHTEYGSEIKKPCVTVTYKKNGEKAYHVDLVAYTFKDKNDKKSQLYLAKGKQRGEENTYWAEADPLGLIDYINNAVTAGDDRNQFRRVVRYLKRWKNRRFDCNGHAEPASIGITLLTADHFQAFIDNDLDALKNIVDRILPLFVPLKYENGRWLYRISCPMPATLNFESGTDVFSKMSDVQMTDFRDRLDKLSRDLSAVQLETDEVEQCKKLNKIFGDDFHIPEAKDVSKKQQNFIPPTSSSGEI